MAERTLKTVGQLARTWGRSAVDIGRELRAMGLNARDHNFKVTVHQQVELGRRLKVATAAEEEPAAAPSPRLELPLDPPGLLGPEDVRALRHPLRVSLQVLAEVERLGLGKRLAIVLQQLAAQGQTSVVKGCAGANAGWLRSPLGGNGGQQYYLWWTKQGNRPVKALDLPRGAICVQAVRHHDDHSPLVAGRSAPGLGEAEPSEANFIGFDAASDAAGLVEAPWTADQLAFIEGEAPVRVVVGRPGSGKTTVLWRAVEARPGQRVLYLTWSRALAQAAEARLASFAPRSVYFEARDFLSLLGELLEQDVPRQPLEASRALFCEAIRHLAPAVLGEWARRPAALFAEVRAFLLGQATLEQTCVVVGGVRRLCDIVYEHARRPELGAAAAAVLRVVRAIEGSLPAVFPELVAAGAALERLQTGAPLPVGFAAFDRVVVDEVQDLTLLEVSVVTQMCRAMAEQRRDHRAPWLLIAGDEGQTVRPTGFDWGRLNEHVGLRVGSPRTYTLDENLRCPSAIAAVIERASADYALLSKSTRPGGQRAQQGGQPTHAHLVHLVVDGIEACNILESLEDSDGVVVISAADALPAWVPEALRDGVRRPADAKGLEYQTVVVLDPGHALAGLRAATSQPFEEHMRRTAIDQLRVALSRATETLVFLDVAAEDEAIELSRRLLGPGWMEVDDLADLFAEQDRTAEDRVLARLREARALLEEQPRRAWLRAHQALQMLGTPELPNSVASASTRHETSTTLLETAAHLLVVGLPAGVRDRDVEIAAHRALEPFGSEARMAFEALHRWVTDRKQPPIDLLEALEVLGSHGQWLRRALVPSQQTLRRSLEAAVADPETAARFAGDVEAWLAATGLARPHAEATRLRRQAFDVLLAADRFPQADQVLARVEPADHRRLARLRVAEARWAEAAEAFEAAGAPDEARRAWRWAGQWERALRLAVPGTVEHGDLAWLDEVAALLARRPPGWAQRATEAERARLQAEAGSP